LVNVLERFFVMEETIKMKYVAPEIVDFRWMEGMGHCASNGSGATKNTGVGLCDPYGSGATYCKSDGNNANGSWCYSNGNNATGCFNDGNGVL
jgi:hypothetical protein